MIRIAAAAKVLDELREAWLNPADLAKRVPEVVPSYPDRIPPVGPKAEQELKKRTLTNLYNERPHWLVTRTRRSTRPWPQRMDGRPTFLTTKS